MTFERIVQLFRIVQHIGSRDPGDSESHLGTGFLTQNFSFAPKDLARNIASHKFLG